MSRPESTRVVATPVSTLVTPARDWALEGLISGLAEVQPSLARYGEARAAEDQKLGAAARTGNRPMDETKGQAWARGYMHMDGVVKGQQDNSKLLETYQTKFDKEGGDVEQFIKEQHAELTKGLTDKHFLGGYNSTIDPALMKIRELNLDYHRKQAVQKVETNAMALLETSIRSYVAAGQPVPAQYIDDTRKQLNSQMGVGNGRFNDLYFEVIKRIGDEGNFAIYDTLKEKKPDGTPGMYFIPEWKMKIDAAQIHSQSVFLDGRAKAEAAAKKGREDRQDTALYEAFSLFQKGDEAGGTAAFARIVSSGLISRASELSKWDTMRAAAIKRDITPQMKIKENDMLAQIMQGKAGIKEIMAGGFTYEQNTSLLSQYDKTVSAARSLQAQARAQAGADRAEKRAIASEAYAIYKTKQFTDGHDFITHSMPRTPSARDPFQRQTEPERLATATAVREFTERAEGVKDPHELYKLSTEIVDRYRKNHTELKKTAIEGTTAGMLRYPSLDELIAAGKRREISADEFDRQYGIFKSLPPTGKK